MTGSETPTPGNGGGIAPSEAAYYAALESEASEVLASPQFVGSPTLVRLLKWLVSETIAGRGNKVKSYTVAVDGLGRHHSFDTKADSYPRVQIGRLRRALASYYAQRRTVDGRCLYLEQGSYQVFLDQKDIAYPQLLRAPIAGDDVGMCTPPSSNILMLPPIVPLSAILLASAAAFVIFVAVVAAILVAPVLAVHH